jgi:hypothetical protein
MLHLLGYNAVQLEVNRRFGETTRLNQLILLATRLNAVFLLIPGYRTEMYCVSYEVRTEFIYVM